MTKFQGFTDSEGSTPIPDSFFRTLMNVIKDSGELKVTLYALWRFAHMEGHVRYLRRVDFAADPDFINALGKDELDVALEQAIAHHSLLRAQKESDVVYFLNSPRGRAAAQAFEQGQWSPEASAPAPPPERPNVYALYEQNIGPLTPLLADALRDAEQSYPATWIEEAITEAVKRNKRNWKYIEAILRRWKEEGRAKEQDRRDTENDRRRYVEGKYSEFIEH